ncbi:MAG: hypothetical protein M3Q65_21205 [Chloroflexota bacterium]|nr:hypothetical protein [Chloroflexota bacterium]
MPDLPKYHLREQQADALLGPIRAALAELEGRASHYLGRLTLAPEDREAVRAAHRALAAARREVERLEGERLGRGR